MIQSIQNCITEIFYNEVILVKLYLLAPLCCYRVDFCCQCGSVIFSECSSETKYQWMSTITWKLSLSYFSTSTFWYFFLGCVRLHDRIISLWSVLVFNNSKFRSVCSACLQLYPEDNWTYFFWYVKLLHHPNLTRFLLHLAKFQILLMYTVSQQTLLDCISTLPSFKSYSCTWCYCKPY